MKTITPIGQQLWLFAVTDPAITFPPSRITRLIQIAEARRDRAVINARAARKTLRDARSDCDYLRSVAKNASTRDIERVEAIAAKLTTI